MTEQEPWTIVFAGAADIDDSDMRKNLEDFLPPMLDVNAPVMARRIPPKQEGLKKVRSWLINEFRDENDEDDDPIHYVGDLPEYISQMDVTGHTYLILLWGDGDQKTEQLADLAQRRGITCLDLTRGLDEFELGDREAGETASPAESVPADLPVGHQAAADGPLVFSPDPDPVRMLAAILARHYRQAADELAGFAGPAPTGTAGGGRAAGKPGEAPAEPDQGSAAPAGRARPGPATRNWLQNPGNPSEYVRRGRGRPKAAQSGWKELALTPEEEKKLGLS